MKFENAFEVDAPVDTVWNTILDVDRVAPTVPGAKVLERTSDTAYKVGIKVKLGPMTMQYKGDVEVTEADESAHRAKMKVKAKEARGQGTADADVTMELTGDEQHTKGTIVTDVKVSGKAASMGRGVMQDVAGRLVGTFAENLAKMLEDGGEPAAEEEPPPEREDPRERAAAASAPSNGGTGGATPAGEEDEALDLGSISGAVLADRLKDPRVIVGLLLGLLLLRRVFR